MNREYLITIYSVHVGRKKKPTKFVCILLDSSYWNHFVPVMNFIVLPRTFQILYSFSEEKKKQDIEKKPQNHYYAIE